MRALATVRFCLFALLCGCVHTPLPEQSAPTFLKGQTHAHSWRSLDSTTRPHAVMTWYAAHGYDFVVMTDHNRVTTTRSVGKTLAIPGVEITQNLEDCDDPAPKEGVYCVFHINSLFVHAKPGGIHLEKPASNRRIDLYGRAVDESNRLGGIAQLNHPNFHHAANAPLITALAKRGIVLLEIANESWDCENEGDADQPSTEVLWDEVLTSGARVWGVASDDAHDFWRADKMRAKGKKPFDGDRGFVMVRAKRDAQSIRDAMLRGDFYSSTGVILDRLDMSEHSISLDVSSTAKDPVRIDFIGTGGQLLDSQSGHHGSWTTDAPGYLRALVTDSSGHKAWTQPAFSAAQ